MTSGLQGTGCVDTPYRITYPIAATPSIPCRAEVLERGSVIPADRLLCLLGQAEAIRRGGVGEVGDLVDLVTAQAQHGDSVGQVGT
jgi:hypothetical protein